jgi:catechol 2,3-dioxygenase-like lactoylglutathione lyase family enzyme
VGLQHVSLEVREADAGAELAFWALLGFAAVNVPTALAGTAAWAQCGATQVHLLFRDEPVVPPAGHAAVVAADYEAALARLRAAGHGVDPRREHWGAPRCFTRTPAGHRVEVMAAAPVRPPRSAS